MSRNISYALSGWLAGVLITIVMGFVWPQVFPGIVNIEHYYGAGPNLLTIIGMALLVISPTSLFGGFVGGRVSIEGGEMGRRLIAGIFGILFSIPCSCSVFMYFTGFGFTLS